MIFADAAGSRVSNVSDDPLRTLRLCDSALKSQHSDGIPRRICRARICGRNFRPQINRKLFCVVYVVFNIYTIYMFYTVKNLCDLCG